MKFDLGVEIMLYAIFLGNKKMCSILQHNAAYCSIPEHTAAYSSILVLSPKNAAYHVSPLKVPVNN